MSEVCPECGAELEPKTTYDVDDYTVWYDGCPNDECDWVPFEWVELGFGDER